MLHIREIRSSSFAEEHIWTKHRVTLEEVEEVSLSATLTIRGREGSYAVYGRTEAGRYLVIFLYFKSGGFYSLATAREMNAAERRYYRSRTS